jgi:Polyketide cyclase / dehydrase and lipid transport
MSSNTRLIKATPDHVWAVLTDGWLYPTWVVGASRMRSVDATWPEPGSCLHHSAGAWPALLDDETESMDCVPERMLRLRARGWPLGEAEVVINLVRKDVGTLVELREQVVAGPGRFLPRPAQDVMLTARNTESLRRLAYLVEGRARN